MINDQDWNANVFLPTVGKRGAAIIEARGLSSAASAANAAIDHMRDWALGSKGKWVTMGIPSDGQYGIPKDTMFGFPVTTEGGEYKLVEGLEIDAFSQECINKTLKELQDELGLNQYDYGARNYDPALGRWMNIDPLANKTIDYSPYNFVLNNPVSFIDPDGLYPKSVLIYNQATNSYRFTNAASHLLSLVSGVDKRQIQNTVINERGFRQYVPFYFANEGGGAITLGSPSYYTITYTQNFFEDDSSKYNGNGFGQDIYTWLSHSSHEVGHIPQIKKAGSSLSYLGKFISQYSKSGNHDGADYEKEADKGSDLFGQFNNFVDKTYGRNSLVNLFENHTDPVIVKSLDKWWGAFEKDREKKEERTNSFMQGLNTNLDNYSEGTYIYDGNNWVKKN